MNNAAPVPTSSEMRSIMKRTVEATQQDTDRKFYGSQGTPCFDPGAIICSGGGRKERSRLAVSRQILCSAGSQSALSVICKLRPLKTKRAEEEAYPIRSMFLTFGVPAILQSDRGSTGNRNVLEIAVGIEDSDFYKLANKNDTIKQLYTRNQFVICKEKLLSIDEIYFQEMSLREAAAANSRSDDFMRGRIIGKIEEGRKITDVAREFDIAPSVVSRLWKSFKTTGMCSRRHGGGRVRSTTPGEDRYIVLSAKRNRRTTASSPKVFQSGGQSDAKPPVFSSQANLAFIYRPRDEAVGSLWLEHRTPDRKADARCHKIPSECTRIFFYTPYGHKKAMIIATNSCRRCGTAGLSPNAAEDSCCRRIPESDVGTTLVTSLSAAKVNSKVDLALELALERRYCPVLGTDRWEAIIPNRNSPPGYRGWFCASFVRLRLWVRPRPNSVDFHDAENRKRPCRMIAWQVQHP
ncbi:KRAB-A domain-containing protein 2 [Trichonephila clavipes]|nr:KRAB-A domain-containing protein 2 [Trichonephila clavipes]